MDEHEEWEDGLENILQDLSKKKRCLAGILSTNGQVISEQRKIMLDIKEIKQDLSSFLEPTLINKTKTEHMKDKLKWAVPALAWYSVTLPSDTLLFSVISLGYTHYSAFWGTFLLGGIYSSLLAGKYLLGNKEFKKGDALKDFFALLSGQIFMACLHDQTPIWHFLRYALTGSWADMEWFFRNWTPGNMWPIGGDWWFFGLKIPGAFDNLSAYQYFALQWLGFGAALGTTIGVSYLINRRRRIKQEKRSALVRLLNSGAISSDEFEKEFNNYTQNNKNKKNKEFLKNRYELEELTTERKTKNVTESLDEVPSDYTKKMSFVEYMMRKDINKQIMSPEEIEMKKIKLRRNCKKYYNDFIDGLYDVLIEKYEPMIEKERQEFNEMIKQVNKETPDEETDFKNFFGKKGKKLYNKLAKGVYSWENKKDDFVNEVNKMLDYKYPIKSIESFIDSFYEWKEPEECLSYLEPAVKN